MKRKPNVALREARMREGLRQWEVAERAEISEIGYKRYELGERVPNAPTANRIADVLHTTSKELFGT